MTPIPENILRLQDCPTLDGGTLVLAFSGWMDGGDVSTGTVQRLVDLLGADPFAEIDPETFYIYNFPGSMEITALFRPHVEIDDGLIKSFDMPSNTFFRFDAEKIVLFIGKEPNLRWQTFGNCILDLARKIGIRRILFVGSFGGAIPHTREPRLYVTCSDSAILAEMEQYGVRRSEYEGPGSFSSYLMTLASSGGFEMASLVAEIPGYLQGANPSSIEAVTRRLAKILQLPLDLDSLRAASTKWELEVSSAIE
ncbi:MAG TPA: PAC2 family protein, partial [Pirellulales bacterium]|nr:PAC2 family protein [Pirellulales bacterium]